MSAGNVTNQRCHESDQPDEEQFVFGHSIIIADYQKLTKKIGRQPSSVHFRKM